MTTEAELLKELNVHYSVFRDTTTGEWEIDGRAATPKEAEKLSAFFSSKTIVVFA